MGGLAEELIASVARRHGLSHAALNALAVIEGNAAPMPTGALAAAMHITSGSVTSVLDTLERNGHIQRLPDPDDRRRVLIEVTPQAQAVLDQLLPEVVQTATAVLGGFDEAELNAFFDMLTRIRAVIGSIPEDLGPPAARRTPPHLKRS